MKKFFQSIKDEDSFEKIIGGAFGVIAIVAIIVEMFLSNFTLDAIAGGTKDIASTLIAVVMLIVAIKALRPNNEKELICQYNKSKKEIEIEFKKPLTTQDDTDMFIRVIRKIYYSYLVLGEPNIDKVNSK